MDLRCCDSLTNEQDESCGRINRMMFKKRTLLMLMRFTHMPYPC